MKDRILQALGSDASVVREKTMIKDLQKIDLRLNLAAGLVFAIAIGLASAGASAQTGFTTVDVAGAGTGAQQGTAVTAIDAAGDIAGIYVDTNNALHCFVLPAGGSVANCDVSGAGSSVGEGTFPTTINTSGVVAGSYIDASQISHGFVRAINGTITKFDAPLASQSGHRGTTVLSINDSGVIIGTYTTGTYSTNSAYYGFMRSADGSTYTVISDPSAGTTEDGNGKKEGTTPVAMNASGMIVGYYIDSSSVQHGFVRSASGTYTQIDPTGVGTCVNQNNDSNFGGTTASGIDAAGDVVGTYLNTSCAQQGFIRNASGTITSFNVPGAASSPCTTNGGSGQKICGTFLVLSDAVGDLTGSYIDTNGTIRGFLRPAATGIFTSFEDPNAYPSGTLNGTIGIAINSQTSGIEIAGMYLDANSVLHGFSYAPSLTATTTTLTPVPTPNPSIYQEPVTLTAVVSSSGGAPPNGENVTFMSGTTSLGTAQLTSGTASLTTTDLPTGTDSITAVYNGDSNFSGSTSTAVSQTVNKASSSTTLKSSLNPSTFGQSVTLTANISGQFSGVATGTVTFSNGSTSLGSSPVSSDTASLTITTLPVGTSSITAVYSGDGNFTGSTSNSVSQVVNASTGSQAATATTLSITSSGSPVTSVAPGTVVALTATVKTESAAVTTGQVKFCDATAAYCADIHLLGTAQLTSAGTAVLKLVPGIGSHSYKAVFVGTTTDGASTSSASALTVTNGSGVEYPTTTTIAQSGSPGNYTLTATVTGSVDRSGLASPSGTVSFLDTSNGNSVLDNASLGAGTPGLNWINSQSPTVGLGPVSIASGDFNGDGIRDLAVVDEPVYPSPTTVTILLGDGKGGFTTAQTLTQGAGLESIAIGDFNGDGIPDLAVVDTGASKVWIFLGNGNGTFTATSASPATGSIPNAVAIGDFNGDGIPDLAVTNEGSAETPGDTVSILLGDGKGGFTPTAVSPATGVTPYAITAADFNGDGFMDLAVATYGTCVNGACSNGSVSVLLGKGDGTFTAAASPSTGIGPDSIVAADFNGDGIPDLAVANSYSDTVTILLGDGKGGFTPAPTLATGNEPLSVAVGDFNGDGIPDLAIAVDGPASENPGSIAIWLGNGDGTFTEKGSPLTGVGPASIAVADFNGDGTPDLAVANVGYDFTGNTATVLLTELTQTATATASGIAVVGSGTHEVEASYPGDSNYSGSVSGLTGLTQPVTKTTTTLTPVPSPDPSIYGESVTLTAAVSSSGGAPPNGESVSFLSGTTTLGTAQLSGGTVSLATTALPVGTDSITAVYIGDSNFASSTSTAVSEVVNKASSSTLLTSSVNPSAVGQSVTFTATVTGQYGGTATGTVTFSNGSTSLGSASLSGGSASLATTALPVGTDSVTAVYVGDGNFTGSTSNSVSQVVNSSGGGGNPGSAELYNPTTGTFSATGGMITNRVQHFASLLPNGTVLVAGGINLSTSTVLSSAEIYNPATGTFSATGNMTTARAEDVGAFIATLLSNGTVLVAGGIGSNGTVLESAEIYDPATGTFSATGPMVNYESTATLLANGSVLGTGAGGGPAEVYNPATGKFTSVGCTIDCYLEYNTATLLPSGTVLLAGGDDSNSGDIIAAAEIYNPTAGNFSATGSMVTPRTIQTATLLSNGTVLLAGGNVPNASETGTTLASAELYNPSAGTFSATGSMTTARQEDTATLLPNGTVLVAGGGAPSTSTILSSAELYNPTTGTFSATGSMTTARADFTATLLSNGMVLMAGGNNNTGQSQAATPTFSVAAGTYTTAQTVTISDATSGATIYYTTNGTTPTASSTKYTGAITVSSTETIEAIATATGYSNSAVASATYTIGQPAATPTFSPVAGTYTAAQSVTINDATSGATIYYTTNGTTPTTSSAKYTGAITVSSTETLEAIATASGYSTSAVATASYTINLPQTATPTFSPLAGTYTAAQSVTISDATSGATIYYTTNGTTPTASSTKYTGAIAVSSTETIEAIATETGYSNSAVATAAYTINSTTGATLVGAPNATGSYYGMFGTDFAAEFTLSTSANVSTIDVVVLGSGIYDFSLQNSLTGSITTYAQAVITAPNSGSNTEAMTVNATLPAGTYYLVASKDAASTQTVPGWFVSDGTYLTNAGTVANGDWYSSSLTGPWTFESGVIGTITYVAPTFIVNGAATSQSAAATPTFSPVGGTYAAAQPVTISDTTPSATIYYTTNGTTPTTSSTVYSGPITVSSSETIEAIATASGYLTSAVGTAAYAINLTTQAATPTFSPVAGTYTSAQSVTISDATSGATIHYTTNGTTPTTSSTVYSGPITVSTSETIEAIATASGYSTSAVGSTAYTINPAASQGFVLYSTVGNAGSYSLYPNSLIAVDPTTGTQQLVGQSGQSINVAWLTADPVHNVLYGTGVESTDSESTLYAINPNSGTIAGQVTLSQNVSAIAASPQGTLYGMSGDTLGTINTATGAYSPVGTVSVPSGYNLQALTFSPGGVLYGVEETGGSVAFNQQLVTLNPANGATLSIIGNLGSYNVEDITYAPDGNIYATNFSYTLMKINPQTASSTLIGAGNIGDLDGIAAIATPVTATPAFSPVAGAYTSAQSVTISDATSGATIYYTTNGTTPTTSSTVYNGPISVSLSETIEAIATATGYTPSTVATAAYTINIPQTSTPTFAPAAGTYTAAQSVTISDATTGATIYYTTNGATPTTSSTQYTGAITVSSSETLEAIATASGYSTSAVATAAYTINLSTNPTPVISGASPAFTNAGGAAFTLTVNGSGFTAGSTVYWGTSALATTYVSATQLTAQVPATDIATGGIAVAITVLTPAPGGGTSSSFQFEVDSASGSTTGPTFTSTTATVTAGSAATYPVTLPSNVTSASVTCLNLPVGATCTYSSSTNALTITTSAATPKGTYQITVVFTETVTVAAAFILLPILLLPLVILRKKLARRGIWITACAVLIMLASVALNVGCGGGGSGGGGGGGGGGTQTEQVTSSGAVSLTVQ